MILSFQHVFLYQCFNPCDVCLCSSDFVFAYVAVFVFANVRLCCVYGARVSILYIMCAVQRELHGVLGPLHGAAPRPGRLRQSHRPHLYGG